jgi:hypothetical protein
MRAQWHGQRSLPKRRDHSIMSPGLGGQRRRRFLLVGGGGGPLPPLCLYLVAAAAAAGYSWFGSGSDPQIVVVAAAFALGMMTAQPQPADDRGSVFAIRRRRTTRMGNGSTIRCCLPPTTSPAAAAESAQPDTVLWREFLEVAVRAAQRAGDIIVAHDQGAAVVHHKANSRDLLTLIDPQCEKVRMAVVVLLCWRGRSLLLI